VCALFPGALWAQYYDGPIVDAHDHLGGSFDWEIMVRQMVGNDVTRRAIMARYYPGFEGDHPADDRSALRLAERYPGRFFVLVGMQRPELTGPDKWRSPDAAVRRLIEDTERKLASGKFAGIGEFIVRHWAYDNGPHAEQDNPIYSTFMKEMSALAARYDVPMVVHMEGYPALVDDLSKLLSEFPRTRVVWAHNCGRSKAEVIAKMLQRHANLFCDLAGMINAGKMNYGLGWPRREEFTALIEEGLELYPEMKALYERFPDRFMLGVDFAHAFAANSERSYGFQIYRLRRLLGGLNEETARKIAESNALRVFKLDQPSGK
jgi:predicted TIM-barrel fold metal-dependent hydrolase